MKLLGVKKLQENTQMEFYFVPDPPKQAGGRVQKHWLGSLLCVPSRMYVYENTPGIKICCSPPGANGFLSKSHACVPSPSLAPCLSGRTGRVVCDIRGFQIPAKKAGECSPWGAVGVPERATGLRTFERRPAYN